MYGSNKAEQSSGSDEQLPRGAKLYRALRVDWNNRKYGASKLGFHTQNNFTENCSEFRCAPSRSFARAFGTYREKKNKSSSGETSKRKIT